jgi:cystathionine beta-lyase
MNDKLDQLRSRQSVKWRRFADDVIPMHVAEMDFPISPAIKTALISMIENDDLGYAFPLPELGVSFSGFSNRHWGFAPNAEMVFPATDVGVAGVELLRSLIPDGGKVLVNSPIYASFKKWIAESKNQIVDAPLQLVDRKWVLDLDSIENRFREGVDAYLLCSPHNPVGAVHSKADLVEIASLAEKYNVVVLADEIHAPLTHASTEFIPFASVSDEARAVGITITSSSKSFNTAGVKGGLISFESESLKSRAMERLPMAVPYRTSILGISAMMASFNDSDGWLSETVSRIESNFSLLNGLLAEKPWVETYEQNATYLAWLNLENLGLENPAAEILVTARVSLVPGSDHSIDEQSYKGFARMNLGTYPEIIEQAVARISALAKSR